MYLSYNSCKHTIAAIQERLTMKKQLSALFLLLAFLFPLFAFADALMPNYIRSLNVPLQSQPFRGELPPWPAVEKTPEGFMVYGVAAWGVSEKSMIRYEHEPGSRYGMHDNSVKYEDALMISGDLETVNPDDNNLLILKMPSTSKAFETVEFYFSLPELRKGTAADRVLTEIRFVKKLENVIFCYSDGHFESSWFAKTHNLLLTYGNDGILTKLQYNPKQNKKLPVYIITQETDDITGEKFYELYLVGYSDSAEEPDVLNAVKKMPFSLVSDQPVPMLIPVYDENPDADADRNWITGIAPLTPGKQVPLVWPSDAITPEDFPEIGCEYTDGKYIYTLKHLYRWGCRIDRLNSAYLAGSDLGDSYPVYYSVYKPQGDEGGDVRVISTLEDGAYYFDMRAEWNKMDISISGRAERNEESGAIDNILTQYRIHAHNGCTLIIDHSASDGSTIKQLDWWTDRQEIHPYYENDQLLYYITKFSDNNYTYTWQVDLSDDQGTGDGVYHFVQRLNKNTREIERFAPSPDGNGWQTDSEEPGFVPEPCEAPDFLELCPFLPLV